MDKALVSAGNFKETAEGIWTAELPAGVWKAKAEVERLQANGNAAGGVLLRGEASLIVPDEPASGALDLGEIPLQKTPQSSP